MTGKYRFTLLFLIYFLIYLMLYYILFIYVFVYLLKLSWLMCLISVTFLSYKLNYLNINIHHLTVQLLHGVLSYF